MSTDPPNEYHAIDKGDAFVVHVADAPVLAKGVADDDYGESQKDAGDDHFAGTANSEEAEHQILLI